MTAPLRLDPHWTTPRFLRGCLLVIGLFIVLVVNREFGVADNGDFSRYVGAFVTKPVDLDVNWPAGGTKEFDWRFFNQPMNYWTAQHVDPHTSWATSASLFWDAGNWLGGLLYHADIVNTRYSGLPFFLLVAFAMIALVRGIDPARPRMLAIAAIAALPLADARLTAYFNGYYGESVPLLAVLLTYAFLMGRALLDIESPVARRWWRATGVLAVAALVLAIFAKRQYLYFYVPALLVLGYLAFLPWRARWAVRVPVFAACAALLAVATYSITVNTRANNEIEAQAARITSYHALYFGLLPHAKDKPGLLRSLGLPQDSAKFIGQSVWGEDRMAFATTTENIQVGTFLKAIRLDPKAFKRSAQTNAKHVGNFDVDLGMVYGASRAYPPTGLTLFTSTATKLSAKVFFFCGVALSLLLLVFRMGLSDPRRAANATLALFLLMVMVGDVVISTFDGQQEARKHVLIASVACALSMLQALAVALHVGLDRLARWREARPARPALT